MDTQSKSETERQYAERRVRELLALGWTRRNIVLKVEREIRHQRTTNPRHARAAGGKSK